MTILRPAPAVPAASRSHDRATGPVPARNPATRIALAAAAALLFAWTGAEIAQHGAWVAGLAGLIGPDLSMLAGGGRGLEPGWLHPRAVPLYNAVHRYPAPVALMAAGAAGVLGLDGFVLGLAWATHITVDRAVGYGLRDRDGFQRAG